MNLALYIANARKAVVNGIGLAGSLLALGLIPEPEAGWISGGIAVGTVIVHYLTPNADAPGETPAGDVGPADDDQPPNPAELQPADAVTATQAKATVAAEPPPPPVTKPAPPTEPPTGSTNV